MLWHCWLGDRKGILCIKTSASEPIKLAVNVSGQGVARSTMWVPRVLAFPGNVLRIRMDDWTQWQSRGQQVTLNKALDCQTNGLYRAPTITHVRLSISPIIYYPTVRYSPLVQLSDVLLSVTVSLGSSARGRLYMDLSATPFRLLLSKNCKMGLPRWKCHDCL